jgi:hypothetical protein
MSSLLCYDPERRIGAEDAGKHPYFSQVSRILAVRDLLTVRLGRPPCRSILTCSPHSLAKRQASGMRFIPSYNTVLLTSSRRHKALASPPPPMHVDRVEQPDINDLESFV